MASKLSVPIIEHGYSSDDSAPALLLNVGGRYLYPVLIAPDDFRLVTDVTGHHHWGVQGRNVVVGVPHRPGRLAVARIILDIRDQPHVKPAFRDGNRLNLMRSNLGIICRGERPFWLTLRPGESDPIHFDGAWPQRTPAALYRHRPPVRPPRDPTMAGLDPWLQHWTQRHA